MTLRRRLHRLEERTSDPTARGPQFPVLWSEEETAPADLPPGSQVVRIIWDRSDTTDPLKAQ